MNTTAHILPPHAALIANADVWLETAAVDQLARVAHTPGCCRAVGMPDLHPGRGIPIGAVFAFRDRVLPTLVGGDAGCGVRMMVVKKARFRGDALLRRVEEATTGPALPDADPQALLTAVWRHGARGLVDVPGVPRSLAALAEAEPEDPGQGPPPADPVFGQQLGTTGGGNHFVELTGVSEVVDRVAVRRLGLGMGTAVVLAHSGSRGLGGAMARRWVGQTLTDPAAYLQELAGAVRYARANRLILCWRLLTALGAARASRLGASVDLVHNTVLDAQVDGALAWVHRKGAAPAAAGETTVVLGSRGTPSWVLLGQGSPDTLCSVAHGAGRKIGRHDAEARLKGQFTRASLRRTAAGGHVICDDPRLLFAEHPRAYKDIAPVVASLEAAGAGRRIAALLPRITIKR